jgi:hypothetical protein
MASTFVLKDSNLANPNMLKDLNDDKYEHYRTVATTYGPSTDKDI